MRFREFITESDEPSRIKIGNNNAATAWIGKVYAKYPHTMQNNHVMTWGSGDDLQFAMFELTPSFSKRGAVEVKWIQAYPLRQGVGSRAMKELQALAREDGISLTLFPWDKGQVSQSKLTKFYKGQGFKPTVKGAKTMFWDPSVNEEIIDEMPLPADWDPQQMRQQGTTFKSRLAYALERAKKLGTGSSRVATTIEYQGRPTVLKIAKNAKGLAQNSVEADILSDGYASQMGILIPIIDYDTQNREPSWVHTELAQKVTKQQLCKLMGCSDLTQPVLMAENMLRPGRSSLENIIQEMREKGLSEEQIETCTEYANKLAELKRSFDVDLGDLYRPANWGLYQGKPVIIDVGFNSNVLNQYYSKTPVGEGVEQRYLTQISNLAWKPLTRSVWNTIQDEGLDEEQDAPKHTDWVMASLDVSAEDAQALQSFDDNAIEDFNKFDIHLKSRYPGLTDLIDYDNGTVTIVKPLKQGVAESLRVDVPNEEWLEGAIEYAKRKSPTHYGLPYMGKTTATVRQVEVPVNLLRRIPGMRREQQNVRQEDLAAIEKIMKDTGKLPIHSHSNEEYKPFINVAYDGSAWVNEGNHRIMAAYRLGWDSLPVEISYFDGGERVESGPMYPRKIGL